MSRKHRRRHRGHAFKQQVPAQTQADDNSSQVDNSSQPSQDAENGDD